VAITLDHGALNPYDTAIDAQLAETKALLEELGLQSAIETGARFLLDPTAKHEPTLVTASAAARSRRVEFLCRAIDVAARLGSDCVSLWSGILHDDASREQAFERLLPALGQVLDYAEVKNVTIGFEPEPGMFIDTMASFAELCKRIDSPRLKLTLDVGHLWCLGEAPIENYVRQWADQIVNVHLEDMRRGVHEHLMFGEGEIDFPPLVAVLAEIGYAGPLHVELSRHSHAAPTAARQAFDFLAPWMSCS
jgi:sugar phosphate isomerase/epimerase